jgi:hypothetical protein
MASRLAALEASATQAQAAVVLSEQERAVEREQQAATATRLAAEHAKAVAEEHVEAMCSQLEAAHEGRLAELEKSATAAKDDAATAHLWRSRAQEERDRERELVTVMQAEVSTRHAKQRAELDTRLADLAEMNAAAEAVVATASVLRSSSLQQRDTETALSKEVAARMDHIEKATETALATAAAARDDRDSVHEHAEQIRAELSRQQSEHHANMSDRLVELEQRTASVDHVAKVREQLEVQQMKIGAVSTRMEELQLSGSFGGGLAFSFDPASPLPTTPTAAHRVDFAVGDNVTYRESHSGQLRPAIVASVSANVPEGEEPEIAVRLADGTIRDTVLARVSMAEGADTSGVTRPASAQGVHDARAAQLSPLPLARVVEPFAGEQPGDLRLEVGRYVQLTKAGSDQNWWRGQIMPEFVDPDDISRLPTSGAFPARCVVICDASDVDVGIRQSGAVGIPLELDANSDESTTRPPDSPVSESASSESATRPPGSPGGESDGFSSFLEGIEDVEREARGGSKPLQLC